MDLDNSARLGRLARLIVSPLENVEACNRYRKLLPDYVDAENDGQVAAQLYPQMRQHLETCLECQSYYADQLAIARREVFNDLPQLAKTPHFDLSFLPPQHSQTFEQKVYEFARGIIQAARPDYLAELEVIQDRLLEILRGLKDQPLLQETRPITAMALGFADQVPAARWVLATFISLQQIRAMMTREEIERLKSAGELDSVLSLIAQKAAKQAGLGRRDSQKFVSAFTKLCPGEL